MKPAAEDAAQIIVHYLRHAAKGTDLSSPDTFAEVEGALQGMIDEAVARAMPRGVQRVHFEPAPHPIEVPDVPRRHPGPSCLLDGTVEDEDS